jgi:hypothetical protein
MQMNSRRWRSTRLDGGGLTHSRVARRLDQTLVDH